MNWDDGVSGELGIDEFLRRNSNVRSRPWEYDISETI
jgi:hypothetical protein